MHHNFSIYKIYILKTHARWNKTKNKLIGRNETAYKMKYSKCIHGKLYKIIFYVQTQCSTSIL